MSGWLPDGTIDHLRDVADWPDLGDRYEVRGPVGRGGTSRVYRARDLVLDRDVAVKVVDVIDPGGAAARRLSREARILAQLEHPGIVPVHDAGTLPDGRLFYVMKLVRGRRLDEALADTASASERLSLFLRVCEAVSFAHDAGVVHRDLKPENVMVGPFGEVLVLDWGVAHERAEASPGDLIVGTPGFMPPEQARAATDVDARADVYALGALLAHLMPYPPPRPIASIVRKAMASDPAARYPTVPALMADLTAYRDGAPVGAHRESMAERGLRIYRRYKVPILLVVTYMIMRVILIVWFGV